MKYIRSIEAALLLVLPVSGSIASEQQEGLAPGAVSPGVYSESGGALGSTDGMIVLWNEDDAALLLNLRYATRGGGDQLGSIGLVYRRSPQADVLDTYYLRTDARNTPNDNTHFTAMLGAERRGRRSTGRFRGYHSPHGADLIASRVMESSETLSDGSARTIRRLYEQYEVPLTGVDIEWGPRIPLPKIMGDLRLLGGWFWTDGSMVSSETGWMSRMEYRPRPMILLEVVAYTNAEFERFEFFCGGRLVIPFGRNGRRDAISRLEPLPFYPRPVVMRTSFMEHSSRQAEQVSLSADVPVPPPSAPSDDALSSSSLAEEMPEAEVTPDNDAGNDDMGLAN